MASFHYSKATVSSNFLAIRSVDATQTILVHQTSYVSILSSLGSIILGLLLTRLHRTALAVRHSGVDVQSSHSRHIDSLCCENGSGWHVSCCCFFSLQVQLSLLSTVREKLWRPPSMLEEVLFRDYIFLLQLEVPMHPSRSESVFMEECIEDVMACLTWLLVNILWLGIFKHSF